MKPALLLVETPRVPPQYTVIVRNALRDAWFHAEWNMREKFGFTLEIAEEELGRTFLADELALLARAAAGEIDRSEENVSIVYETLQDILEFLFARPYSSSYPIPEEFWTSPLGQMFSRVAEWLREGETLLSLAEAARRAGVSVQAVSQAIRDGRLPAVYEGRRKRVRARDVERLWSKEKTE